MIEWLNDIRDITLASICVRLLLAFVCGGIIGIEREYRRRPAGFRTHILICLGAAMTTLTSQYLFLVMHYYTDIARLGAQVVAGIGFIGAGTIIVTRRQRVKGLTTAASLWATAVIGLTFGSGFYEGGLIATALVMLAELFLTKLEYRILNNTLEVNLYLEYRGSQCMDEVLKLFREKKVTVLNLEIARRTVKEEQRACAVFSLRLPKKVSLEHLVVDINAIGSILSVEEL